MGIGMMRLGIGGEGETLFVAGEENGGGACRGKALLAVDPHRYLASVQQHQFQRRLDARPQRAAGWIQDLTHQDIFRPQVIHG